MSKWEACSLALGKELGCAGHECVWNIFLMSSMVLLTSTVSGVSQLELLSCGEPSYLRAKRTSRNGSH